MDSNITTDRKEGTTPRFKEPPKFNFSPLFGEKGRKIRSSPVTPSERRLYGITKEGSIRKRRATVTRKKLFSDKNDDGKNNSFDF